MRCSNPINIKGVYCPCGKCLLCKIARRTQWVMRLVHELTYWDKACFVTLTYDDAHLPVCKSVCRKHLQDFFKRLRKNTGRSLKYYGCGEYGENKKRPHYHAVIFGLSPYEVGDYTFQGTTDYFVKDSWDKGMVCSGYATPNSIQYVAQYIDYASLVPSKEHIKPFQAISQGLGLRHAMDDADRIKKHLFIYYNSTKISVPRYYRKKLGITADDYKKLIEEQKDELLKSALEYNTTSGVMQYLKHMKERRRESNKRIELEFKRGIKRKL